MELLRSVLKNLPEFQELTAALEGGKSPAAVSGLAAVHRAHFAAALGQETGRPVVVVCADEGEAGRMARDLSYLTGGEVPVLASRSFVFHSIATVSRQWEHRRLALLWKLRNGELPCLVATVEACCGSSAMGSSPVWWPRWRPSSSAPCPPRCWTGPAPCWSRGSRPT